MSSEDTTSNASSSFLKVTIDMRDFEDDHPTGYPSDVEDADDTSESTLTIVEDYQPEEVIKFQRTSPDAILPKRASPLSAGLDLYAPQDGVLPPMEPTKIPLALKAVPPKGHYLRIAPRSSLAAKGVDCMAGVVDEDYRGELICLLINLSMDSVAYKRGDAIAQLICEKISYPVAQEVTEDVTNTHSTVRGEGGFGSTNAVPLRRSERLKNKPSVPYTTVRTPRVKVQMCPVKKVDDVSVGTDEMDLDSRPTPTGPCCFPANRRSAITTLSEDFTSKVALQDAKPFELTYWCLVDAVIKHGELRPDTNHGASYALFKPFDFCIDVKDGINYPLLINRRVYFKGVAAELLWFLSGSCHSGDLERMGCKIWRGNSTKEYLATRGLAHYQEGEVGPMYGFQWRHFGAEYRGPYADYTGCGVDQIAQLVDRLRNHPNDRGHVLTAYNPLQKKQQCVTPCHVYTQFFVSDGGKQLNLAVVQRSVDVVLGLPFNLASYSLLLIMVARVLGMRAGMYYHSCLDTHIYSDHVPAMKEYVKRYFATDMSNTQTPTAFVPVKDSIDDYKLEDLLVLNYKPFPNVPNFDLKMNA